MLFGDLLSGMGNSSVVEASACTHQTEKLIRRFDSVLPTLHSYSLIGKAPGLYPGICLQIRG